MRIFKIQSDELKLRFIFQRLRQQIRLKVSKDIPELTYESLVKYLKVNYGLKRKMTLYELRQLARQKRDEDVEKYYWRIKNEIEGKIELPDPIFQMAILEGLLTPIYNRILKDEFEDNVDLLKELLSAQNRARIRGELVLKREKALQENSFKRSPERANKRTCTKCGYSGHVAARCYTKERNYKNSRNSNKYSKQDENGNNRQKLSEVEEFFVEENSLDDSCKVVQGFIGKDKVRIKLDTGAEATVIDKNKVKSPLKRSSIVLRTTAKGGKIPHLGTTTFLLTILGQTKRVTAFVVESLEGKDILLGMPDIEHFDGKLSICGKIIENLSTNYSYLCDYPALRSKIDNAIRKHYHSDPKKPSKLQPVKIDLKYGVLEEQLMQKPYNLNALEREVLKKR